MTTRLIVLLVVAVLGLPACFDAEPDLGKMRFACQSDSDCLDGYRCRLHEEGNYCTPFTEPYLQPDAEPDTSGEPDVGEPSETVPVLDSAASE